MGKKTAASLDGEAWFGAPVGPLVPLDTVSAEAEIGALADAARDGGFPRLAALLSGDGPLREFLAAAFDLSFFLRDCARRRPEMLDRLFDEPVQKRLVSLAEEIGQASSSPDITEQALMTTLRRLKTEAHFLIAL
ncbi:MAG: bifunctional [glutamine synthetase] adenylyltransferase/[glutamine synthetase]-adenylyl-L-tyrosine phosphorylase, partial [Rhizobiaceae bacterium]